MAGGAVPTPNIDSIGHEGASFAQGYAANATCAPSRASIMTGRYSTTIGYEFTPTPKSMPRIMALFDDGGIVKTQHFADLDKKSPRLAMTLPKSELLLSELPKGQGYHTLHFGKWHLGSAPGTKPHERGFDESLGGRDHRLALPARE